MDGGRMTKAVWAMTHTTNGYFGNRQQGFGGEGDNSRCIVRMLAQANELPHHQQTGTTETCGCRRDRHIRGLSGLRQRVCLRLAEHADATAQEANRLRGRDRRGQGELTGAGDHEAAHSISSGSFLADHVWARVLQPADSHRADSRPFVDPKCFQRRG